MRTLRGVCVENAISPCQLANLCLMLMMSGEMTFRHVLTTTRHKINITFRSATQTCCPVHHPLVPSSRFGDIQLTPFSKQANPRR